MPTRFALGVRYFLAVAFVCLGGPATGAEPKRLLLLAGEPDGHPAATHEFAAGMRLLEKMLAPHDGLVDVALHQVGDEWPAGPELLAEADGVVLYLTQGARWIVSDEARHEAFVELMNRGGGVTCLHWATGGKDAEYVAPFLALVGRCHGGPDRKYTYGPYVLTPNAEHPIGADWGALPVDDEFYYSLKRVEPSDGLARAASVEIEGTDYTVAWTYERPAGGRAFGFTALHYHRNWRLPTYRRLVLNGVFWTLDLPPLPADADLAVIPAAEFDLPAGG